MAHRLLFLIAAVCAFAVTAAPASAATGSCLPKHWPYADYPGEYDDVTLPKEAIAQWMGMKAACRNIPEELPVMAALAETGLRPHTLGDGDSAGFFAMRQDVWNIGAYAGFSDDPVVQLDWFLDQAEKLARTRGGYPKSSARYGTFIADIQRPASPYRGRYQKQLRRARILLTSA